MSTQIRKREDVDPEEGLRDYGDVEFADPVNHKYPIDNPEHILAAWRYIHQERNRDEYSDDEVRLIEDRIVQAASEHGMDVWEDSWGTHIGEPD